MVLNVSYCYQTIIIWEITKHGEQTQLSARPQPPLRLGQSQATRRTHLRHQEQHQSGTSSITQAKEAH